MRRAFLALASAAAALHLFATPGLAAEETTVTTYYPSPDVEHRHLVVKESMTVGASGPGTVTLYGRNEAPQTDPEKFLSIQSNMIGGWNTATTSGGNLLVSDSLRVENTGGQSLLFVDAASNRVGVGTDAPRTTLEVIGNVKGMIVAAHHDTVDYAQPWAEMYSEVNTVDSTDSAVENFKGARFTAAYRTYNYFFCTMHIDASPLVFQTVDKPGISLGQGKGQVVIRGVQITTDDDLILIVGETAGDYGGVNPVCRANAWSPLASSAAFKKDIQPLGDRELAKVSADLWKAPVYRYHYKTEDASQPLHTGFAAEEAPLEVVSGDRRRIDLGEQMGFLLAAAKAEDARISRLESRLNAAGDPEYAR